MSEFKLIKPDELEQYRLLLKRHGFPEEDFRIEEQVFDPATAEVEAEFGEVTLSHTRTHRVGVYHLGRGTSWVEDFADDLRRGKFGEPPGSSG